MDRVVVLIDMDCFYVQVEQRLDPSLTNLPCAVVQYNEWQGGAIIAVNYEARAFGVKRPMRGNEAIDLCPDIKLVKVPEVREKADLTRYRDAGAEVIDVLKEFGDSVERASIDEAYVDLTSTVDQYLSNGTENPILCNELDDCFVIGWEPDDENLEKEAKREQSVSNWLKEIYDDPDQYHNDIKLAVGAKIAKQMRDAILKKTQFKCSAGVAHNKMIAKFCCGMNKPNKQTVVPFASIQHLYKMVPVKKVRGFGGKFGEEVREKLKITYMSEISSFSLNHLINIFGEKSAKWLFDIGRGLEHEAVAPRLLPKSVGCSKNFLGPKTLKTKEQVKKWFLSLAMELEERLNKDKISNKRIAKHMTVGVTTLDESNRKIAVSRSCPVPSYCASRLQAIAYEAISKVNNAPKKSDAWVPPVINVCMSAGKFEDDTGCSSSITKFFSMSKSKFQSTNFDDNIDRSEMAEVKSKTEQRNNLSIARFFTQASSSNASFEEEKPNCNEIEHHEEILEKDDKNSNSFFSTYLKRRLAEKTSDIDTLSKSTNSNVNKCVDNLQSSSSEKEICDIDGCVVKKRKISKNVPHSSKNSISNMLKSSSINNSNKHCEWQQMKVDEIDESVLNQLPADLREEIMNYKHIHSQKQSMKVCSKCSKEVEEERYSEHMDFHTAEELSHQLNDHQSTRITVTSNSSNKSQSKKQKINNVKKISSYFQ